ncbi:MAG: 50S ribosomal protein L9 [Deltaproteobacteria bacterium]|nr:50S ribosomal protein L9 [Deltaproteobacteria bacterium]
MADKLQVILREDVPNLGKSGQLVKVAPGYARNYLLPQSLAAPATRASVARIEHEKRSILERAAKVKKSATAISDKLAQISVEISKRAGENERLFGSVTTTEIAAALKDKGLDVDRRKIVIGQQIRQLGVYDVQVKLAPEVTGTFKLWVVAQK